MQKNKDFTSYQTKANLRVLEIVLHDGAIST